MIVNCSSWKWNGNKNFTSLMENYFNVFSFYDRQILTIFLYRSVFQQQIPQCRSAWIS